MKRSWALLLLTAAACQSGPPPAPDPSDYYGLRSGLVRRYRVRFPVCGNPWNDTMERRVIGPLACDGGRAALIEVRVSPRIEVHAIPSRWLEVFAETDAGFGFYTVESDRPSRAEPGRVIVEVAKPVRAGARWEIKRPDGEALLDAKIEAVESVTVAAGTFADCARVRFEARSGEVKTVWFAPGVGMVKGHSEGKEKDGRPSYEYELLGAWVR